MKALITALLFLTIAADARAQSEPFAIRGFADAGVRTFAASRSVQAILGHDAGPIVGGGVDIVERHGFFGEVHASRFRRTGQRVFAAGGQVFTLDVRDTITITPVEITGGYRVDRGWRVVPYAGGGAGWHRYEETSPSSAAGEDVKEIFIGYHVLGGAEVRLWRWLSVAGEAQWTTIPGALGQNPNSVARAFRETDLGGTSARVKFIIGR